MQDNLLVNKQFQKQMTLKNTSLPKANSSNNSFTSLPNIHTDLTATVAILAMVMGMERVTTQVTAMDMFTVVDMDIRNLTIIPMHRT